jgi:hypothetical protein
MNYDKMNEIFFGEKEADVKVRTSEEMNSLLFKEDMSYYKRAIATSNSSIMYVRGATFKNLLLSFTKEKLEYDFEFIYDTFFVS